MISWSKGKNKDKLFCYEHFKMIKHHNLLFFTFFFFCILIPAASYAQSCDCAKAFQEAKSVIERNYAGFGDKVTVINRQAYNAFTAQIERQILDVKEAPYCAYFIQKWFTFFKDGHIQLTWDRSNPVSIEQQQGFEKELAGSLLPDKKLEQLRNSKEIEGIYWSQDSLYKIAIVKSPNKFGKYTGVVLTSSDLLWKPGKIILELKQESKDSIEGLNYMRRVLPERVIWPVSMDNIGDWRRDGTPVQYTAKKSHKTVSSEVMSEKTFYIKISTFNQANAKSIDSLFKANRQAIINRKNMILDLRGNGGGADFSYDPIIDYIYTDSIRNIGADVFSSEDNIDGWRVLLNMNDIPEATKIFVRKLISDMKAHKNQFVSITEDSYVKRDTTETYPEKIAILIDKGCGSTTEEFLLTARQSKKVILMGQHSAGVLDYANMRGKKMQYLPYALYYATSRSRRVDRGEGIDNKGIAPQILLAPGQDWIKTAQDYLETK